jgi:hypothetical protein
MKDKTIFWMIVLSTALVITLLSTGTVSAQGCAISPGFDKPLMSDIDCDGLIDPVDNCVFITNPLQQDSDNNGLGDACDLYLESIRTNPADFVFNGRAFSTMVMLHNNRDYNIRNMRVRVIMPELGIESVQYVDNLQVCGSRSLEFTLRAPACVQMSDYRIIVEISFMDEFGIEETITGVTSIRVVPDQYCEMVLNNNQEIGNTFIDVMEIQDVYKGSESVFPIKITNREQQGKEYIISATGFDGWGKSRVYPNSLLVIPSGAERTADLYVKADEGVAPGERTFVVTVQSGEEVQRFLLIANVKEAQTQDNSFMWIFAFKVLIIFILLVLLVIAIIVGVRKLLASAQKDPGSSYY